MTQRIQNVFGRTLKTVDGSPAALAGIQKNDVIVQLDGQSVSDNAGFMPSPDKETRVTLIRDGTWRDLMVHVGTRTEQLAPIAYLVDIERGTTLVARKER